MSANKDLSCFTEVEEIPSKFQLRGDALRVCIQDLLTRPEDQRIHPYQINAVLETRKMLLKDTTTNEWSSSPALIVAPTGSGKSGMIVLLPYILQSKKVLVLTPSGVISNQLAAAFGHYRPKHKHFFEVSKICTSEAKLRGFLENVSLIESSKTISNKGQLNNVVIVNAQKFGGRSKASLVCGDKEVVHDATVFFAQFDTLIVDEAHHYPAETWLKIVDAFKAEMSIERRIIFLTATPYRYRGKDCVPIVPSQRIAYVVKLEEIEGKTIRRSDFREKEDREDLYSHIKNILNEHQKTEPRMRHQAMILVRTKEEARENAEFLNHSKRDFAVAIFFQESKEKDVADFNRGKYTVAITCGLLLEGYDNSNVSLCVILRNVTSQILFDQFIGRCLRLKKFDEKETSDSKPDQTRATVLSYNEFNQRRMWEQRNKLASEDPEDDDIGPAWTIQDFDNPVNDCGNSPIQTKSSKKFPFSSLHWTPVNQHSTLLLDKYANEFNNARALDIRSSSAGNPGQWQLTADPVQKQCPKPSTSRSTGHRLSTTRHPKKVSTVLSPSESINTIGLPNRKSSTPTSSGQISSAVKPTYRRASAAGPPGNMSSTEKPTGHRSLTVKPTGHRSSTVKPTPKMSSTEKPTGHRSLTVKPTGHRSSTVKPTGHRSSTVKPTGHRSSTVKPTGHRSSTVKPTPKMSSTVRQPDQTQPTAGHSGRRQSIVRHSSQIPLKRSPPKLLALTTRPSSEIPWTCKQPYQKPLNAFLLPSNMRPADGALHRNSVTVLEVGDNGLRAFLR